MRRVLAAAGAALLLAACGSTPTHQSATGSVHPAGWGKPAPASAYPHTLGFTATPTGVMYDSVTVSQIPANPFAAAGYNDGHYLTWGTIRRTWPLSHAVSIAVFASGRAACGDFEAGDMGPGQVVAWVRADRATHPIPCIYSSWWEFVNQIRPALAAGHIARSSIFEWDADYRGCNGTIDTGFDATQCTDHALNRNLDQSVVTLKFLSIAQPPYRAPQPLPVCIHHRLTRADCTAGKQLLAKRARGYQATGVALGQIDNGLHTHNCRPRYRRSICRDLGHDRTVLTKRFRWFQTQARQLEGTL